MAGEATSERNDRAEPFEAPARVAAPHDEAPRRAARAAHSTWSDEPAFRREEHALLRRRGDVPIPPAGEHRGDADRRSHRGLGRVALDVDEPAEARAARSAAAALAAFPAVDVDADAGFELGEALVDDDGDVAAVTAAPSSAAATAVAAALLGRRRARGGAAASSAPATSTARDDVEREVRVDEGDRLEVARRAGEEHLRVVGRACPRDEDGEARTVTSARAARPRVTGARDRVLFFGRQRVATVRAGGPGGALGSEHGRAVVRRREARKDGTTARWSYRDANPALRERDDVARRDEHTASLEPSFRAREAERVDVEDHVVERPARRNDVERPARGPADVEMHIECNGPSGAHARAVQIDADCCRLDAPQVDGTTWGRRATGQVRDQERDDGGDRAAHGERRCSTHACARPPHAHSHERSAGTRVDALRGPGYAPPLVVSPTPRLVLVHGPPEAFAHLERALAGGEGELHLERAESEDSCLERCRGPGGSVPACVLVVDDPASETALRLLRSLNDLELLTCPRIVVSSRSSRELERTVLREGASELVAFEGLDRARLVRAVEDARDRFEAVRRCSCEARMRRAREERYATLFAKVDEGFCILEMLFDADGEPIDYRFLETNAAFEAHTGLVDAVGRTARELVPDLESVWFERYGRVAKTRTATRFEEHAPAMGRWFSVFATPIGPPDRHEVALVFQDITARKRAEQALRDSEERALAARVAIDADRALLDAILTAAPVGIIVADANGKLVRMNPANERLWGIAPFSANVDEYAEWKGWWADGSERDGRRIAPQEWAMARALRGEIVPGDIVAIEPFGHPGLRRTMLNSAAPVRSADGRIAGAVIAQMDITKLVEAEAAVRLNEERYRLAGRATNDVLWDWDFATGHIEWNEAIGEHFGETRETFGASIEAWEERIHPDDRERVGKGLAAALEGDQESWSDQYRFRRRDGTYATFLDRGYISRDASGRAVRMIGTMLDLSERLAAQAALEDSQERFRTLADNISQLAWMADEQGSIFWFNRRWYEYTGKRPEEVLGSGWKQILDPEEVSRVEETFARALATGEEWEDTFAMRSKDGELRAFLTRAMPVKDEQGRVVRWFGTNTDVEEHRRHATALREAIQVRDTFLQVAAHELRTPLTALTLQLESLDWLTKGALRDPARVANKVAMAVRQTDRLSRLIEDLLDVSRITSGRLRLELDEVDLADVVRETVEKMRDMASRAGCELHVDVAEHVEGRWDRSRLEQVVTNLVTNAIKYGRGRPVDVGIERRNGTVELHVRDHGIGISPEDQARIFDRFERAVSADHYGGLGLGLYIAREIVQAHGGRIFVENPGEGDGATFTVHLPAEHGANEKPSPPPSVRRPEQRR